MKNKTGNVVMIAIVIVIIAITVGVIGWMFTKKSQAPVQQAVQNKSLSQTQETQPEVQLKSPATQSTYNGDGYSLFADLTVKKDSQKNNSPKNVKIANNVTTVRAGEKIAFGFIFSNFAVGQDGKAKLEVTTRLINPRQEVLWEFTNDISEGLTKELSHKFLESTPYSTDDFSDIPGENKYPKGVYKIEGKIKDYIKNSEIERDAIIEKL